MLKEILQKYRTWLFAKSQHKQVMKPGTLLNAFYNSKTIFIHIPKTAGVSLIKAIYGDVTLSGHRSFYFNSIALNIKKEKYFSFTFVRNPFDRLYSAYMFLKKGGLNIHDQVAYQTYLSQFNDFEDFVINGLDEKVIFEIIHFIPQYKFLCDTKDNILVDFVGKYEHLQKDISILANKLDRNINLNHYNYNKKKDYREVYTDEMIASVTKVYQKDMAIFKYNFQKC